MNGAGQLFYRNPAGELGQTPSSNYDWVNGQLATEIQGGVQRRYVYGPRADEALVWYEGAGTSDRRYLHADERGSIVAVSNDAGNAVAINTYDEYGIPGLSNQGRFQYTGQIWQPELGMYDFKARMYSPTLGRFMQTDPIGYGDGLNWYNYVGGDPVNSTDPSGLRTECFTQDTSHYEYAYYDGALHLDRVVSGVKRCVDIPDGQPSQGTGVPSAPSSGSIPAAPAVPQNPVRLGVCRLATSVKNGGDAFTQLGLTAAVAGGVGGAAVGGLTGAGTGAAPGLATASIAGDVSSGAQLAIDLSQANSVRSVGVAFVRAGVGIAGGRILSGAFSRFRIGPWLGRAEQAARNKIAGGIIDKGLSSLDSFLNPDNGCK